MKIPLAEAFEQEAQRMILLTLTGDSEGEDRVQHLRRISAQYAAAARCVSMGKNLRSSNVVASNVMLEIIIADANSHRDIGEVDGEFYTSLKIFEDVQRIVRSFSLKF